MLKKSFHSVVAPVANVVTRSMLRILVYHRFGHAESERAWPVDRLEKQLRYLTKQCTVMPLSEAIDQQVTARRRHRPMVAVTVDDGYRDFIDVAWPVFEKLGIRPTVFICSRFVANDQWMWPDAIRYLLNVADVGTYDLAVGRQRQKMLLDSSSSRAMSWETLCNSVLYESTSERNALVAALGDAMKVGLPAKPTAEYAAMSWQDIRDLVAAGVEIGAHGRTHGYLGSMSETELDIEIAGCRDDICRETGISPRAFAYSNGTSRDCSPTIESAVVRAGFESAVVAYPRTENSKHRYGLGRWSGTIGDTDLKHIVTGSSYLPLMLRKVFRSKGQR